MHETFPATPNLLHDSANESSMEQAQNMHEIPSSVLDALARLESMVASGDRTELEALASKLRSLLAPEEELQDATQKPEPELPIEEDEVPPLAPAALSHPEAGPAPVPPTERPEEPAAATSDREPSAPPARSETEREEELEFASPLDDREQEKHLTTSEKIGRVRVDEIIQEASQVDDREVELSWPDREQLELVAWAAHEILQPVLAQPDWKTFRRLADEGYMKGALALPDFTSHEGIFVPEWCVDGGPGAEIKKINRKTPNSPDKGADGIQVPTMIFNIYNIQRAISTVQRWMYSDKPIKGTSAKSLSEALSTLEHFIEENNTSNESQDSLEI